jgi:phosphoglycolate phosphatase-like HAD superfamily hydrolase
MALMKLGSLARETLYVGDSQADMESARAAGCFSCRATWGLKEGENTSTRINEDFIAPYPEAILDFVHTNE